MSFQYQSRVSSRAASTLDAERVHENTGGMVSYEIEEDIEYDDDFDTESEDDIDERVAIIKAGGSSIGRPSSRSGGRVSLSIERPTQVSRGPPSEGEDHIEDIRRAMEVERERAEHHQQMQRRLSTDSTMQLAIPKAQFTTGGEREHKERLKRLRELEKLGVKRRIGTHPETFTLLDQWPESEYVLLLQNRGSRFSRLRSVGSQCNDDSIDQPVQTILPEGCPAAVQSDPLPPGDRAPGGLRDAADRMLAALGEGISSMSHQPRGNDANPVLTKLWTGVLPRSLGDPHRVAQGLISLQYQQRRLIGVVIDLQWELAESRSAFTTFMAKHGKTIIPFFSDDRGSRMPQLYCYSPRFLNCAIGLRGISLVVGGSTDGCLYLWALHSDRSYERLRWDAQVISCMPEDCGGPMQWAAPLYWTGGGRDVEGALRDDSGRHSRGVVAIQQVMESTAATMIYSLDESSVVCCWEVRGPRSELPTLSLRSSMDFGLVGPAAFKMLRSCLVIASCMVGVQQFERWSPLPKQAVPGIILDDVTVHQLCLSTATDELLAVSAGRVILLTPTSCVPIQQWVISGAQEAAACSEGRFIVFAPPKIYLVIPSDGAVYELPLTCSGAHHVDVILGGSSSDILGVVYNNSPTHLIELYRICPPRLPTSHIMAAP